MEEQAVIFGVKSGDKYHYIGKTHKELGPNGLQRSNVSYQYVKGGNKIRNFFKENEDIIVEKLKSIPRSEWYDEKLHEVVAKHSREHPLLNAEWMKEGKRGYWEGKERDPHTLQRLSESKYKKFLQYDHEGNLVKTWDSGREAGLQFFGDYTVIHGYGRTKLYRLVANGTLKGKKYLGYYWFKYEQIKNQFGKIPKKLNISKMLKEEAQQQADLRAERRADYAKPVTYYRHTIVRYDKDRNIIARYDNTAHAAYELRTSIRNVARICKLAKDGKIYNENYLLEYGEKKYQTINPQYPKYKVKPLKKSKNRENNYNFNGKPRYIPKEYKPKEKRIPTETRTTVEYWVNEIKVAIHRDVEEAANYHNLSPNTVRNICTGGYYKNKKHPDLRYGVKLTTPK